MNLNNIFDIAMDETFEMFIEVYESDKPNIVDKYSKLSLLLCASRNSEHPIDRTKILTKLVSDGADVNYIAPKYKRNALHIMYMLFGDKNPTEMLNSTKVLVNAGIDINHKDKYGVIPLKYAICNLKMTTDELAPLYKYLLEQGSDYKHIDSFGKSCLDYAKRFSWRNEFLDMVEEFEKN